jgi:hypothetical protein
VLQNTTDKANETENILSVCFRKWSQQIFQRQWNTSARRSWTTSNRRHRYGNTQDIEPCCNHSAVQGYIWRYWMLILMKRIPRYWRCHY